jgi:hypothetical protein
MPGVLAALLAFLTGRIGPKRSSAARQALVPLAQVGAKVWLWSILGGGAAVVAAAALWTVLASLVRVPPNLLPDTHGVPLWTLIPMLLVSIAAAPLTEEAPSAATPPAMGPLRPALRRRVTVGANVPVVFWRWPAT